MMKGPGMKGFKDRADAMMKMVEEVTAKFIAENERTCPFCGEKDSTFIKDITEEKRLYNCPHCKKDYKSVTTEADMQEIAKIVHETIIVQHLNHLKEMGLVEGSEQEGWKLKDVEGAKKLLMEADKKYDEKNKHYG